MKACRTKLSPRWTTLRAFLVAASAVLLLGGCNTEQSMFNPAGPAASQINILWWVMFVIAAVVFLIVLGLLLLALFRPRERTTPGLETRVGPETSASSRAATTFVVVSGAVIPAVILIGLFVFVLGIMSALAQPPEQTPLTIDIVGHQFWWEVRYPDHNVLTANEIHIPVGQSVRFNVTSNDVIHSLWIPELNGKIDLIPGQQNTLWVQADKAGEYRGQCAEFCGVQHAKMALLVVAQPVEEFNEWVAIQAQPAAPAVDGLRLQGQQIFLGSACVYCHTIRGTNATSTLGPDLTHLASRRTIGAGILPNTRGYLAGWIIDAQSIKPGNKMPPMYLSSEALDALLFYLESLQ